MLRLPDNELFNRLEFNKTGNKLVTRIYISLGIGLTARLLGIRPSKLSVAGVEMTISNANVVPGFFFLVSVILTVVAIFYAAFFGFHTRYRSHAILRIVLYRVSVVRMRVRNKTFNVHTFRGSPASVRKKVARRFFCVYLVGQFLLFAFPALFVLLFEREAMFDAVAKRCHRRGQPSKIYGGRHGGLRRRGASWVASRVIDP